MGLSIPGVSKNRIMWYRAKTEDERAYTLLFGFKKPDNAAGAKDFRLCR